MGVEKQITNTFEQYKRDEETLEKRIIQQHQLKVAWFTSGAWFTHMGLITFGFVKLISVLVRVDPSGAAPALTGVFGGALVLCWFIFGTYFFFKDGYDRDSWVDSISSALSTGFARKREIDRLMRDQSKREEYFKFYELYQADENFRDAYNVQMSRKAESDEFLKKIME